MTGGDLKEIKAPRSLSVPPSAKATPKCFAHHGRHDDQDGRLSRAFDVCFRRRSLGLSLLRNRRLTAKDILLDLAGGCFRQLGHKLDSLGTRR